MPQHFQDKALVLAPRGRDAALVKGLFTEAGMAVSICLTTSELCAMLNDDIGFALLTEEAVRTGDLSQLAGWVEEQPAWSDFPFVLVTEKGGGPERNPAAARISAILGNVSFLERPFHPTTLVSVARTALRGRKRQYQARMNLEQLRQKEGELETRVQERTKQIMEQGAFVRTMISSVPAGIITYDNALVVRTWNPFVESLTGIKSDAAIGHAFADVSATIFSASQNHMRATLEGTASDVIEQSLEIRETGKRASFEIQHAPLRGADGSTIGGIAFVHDITARKAMEEQLRQSQKMEAIGQLTGGVAHDFNNLLTAVLSNLELIKKYTAGDAKLQQLVGTAMQGAERGASLTQRLLAFARRQDLQAEPVKIDQLLLNLSDLLQRSAGPKTSLHFNLPSTLPAAQIDRNQVELAVLNLTVNARDAMPSGGDITVSARLSNGLPGIAPQSGPYVVVSVTDTGSGMDAQTLQQAIEPFFSTKELGKGTGLGLSMVHGLAVQLGGAFHLHSEIGKGTTAELWLPVAEDCAEIVSPPIEMPALPESAERSTILVVDDDVLIAMSTVALLEDMGHNVIEANSGKIALQMLENNPSIQMMITDHAMPGMTGVELAKAAKRLRPELPILLATGYAELPEGEELQLPRLGKPYHQNELAEHVARMLN